MISEIDNIVYIEKEIEGCELSITDKAKCISCKKVIAQGTPRLWTMGELKQPPPDEGIIKIKRFICNACTPMHLKYKERLHNEEIRRGIIAQEKLTKQNIIKKRYLNYLKQDTVIRKVKDDEVLRELEKEES